MNNDGCINFLITHEQYQGRIVCTLTVHLLYNFGTVSVQ